MNPIFAAVTAALLHLKRTCPNCNRRQVVPVDKRKETVRCQFCGAAIPPHRSRATR
jgi:ribosomal protein S27E